MVDTLELFIAAANGTHENDLTAYSGSLEQAGQSVSIFAGCICDLTCRTALVRIFRPWSAQCCKNDHNEVANWLQIQVNLPALVLQSSNVSAGRS